MRYSSIFICLFFVSNVFAKDFSMKLKAPEYQFSTAETYYSSPVYFGGDLGFFPFKEGYTAVVNPILGVRIKRRWHIGLSTGIQFRQTALQVPLSSQTFEKYMYNEAYYDIAVFSRYFFYRRYFFQIQPGIINLKAMNSYPYFDTNLQKIVENSERRNVMTTLVGLGLAKRIGDQSILVLTVLYDVVQPEEKPYGSYPFLRGGFNLGF